ncbi:OmpA family protein [Verrucomicrobiales bacterium BCK34]|nr:OmpA family protein [Verrucomicrobiales bacterium BCK34]
MKFVFIVILFVVAVAVFTILAGFGYRSSVEGELRQLALVELKEAGYDGVDVRFDYLHARVTGEVDSEADKAKVLDLLSSKVPTGHFPAVGDASLAIRPTLHPEIHVIRTAGGNDVSVTGSLAPLDEPAVALIAGRLNSLEAIETINNSLGLDPQRFTFPAVAELASLAAQLIDNSEEAEVQLQGNVLTIKGKLANDGLKASLLDLASRIGAGEVVDQLTVAEPVSLRIPSAIKVTRNRFGVIVSGTLGSEESKSALISVFSGMDSPVHLTDKIEVSRLHSAALWEDFAADIIPTLLATFSGELTADFSAEAVRLSGKVVDEAAREVVIASFQDLSAQQPSLELLTEIEILDAPMQETASVQVLAKYEGELLVLDGIIPSSAFVKNLEARFADKFPDISIKDELAESEDNVEAPWLDNLPEFFEELISRTDSAKVEFKGETLLLEGTVKLQSDKQILQNIAINSLPEGTVIKNELMTAGDRFPQLALMPEVRTQIAESLKALPIYFDSGSEIVKASQSEKVDSIVEIITKTGMSPPILVTGFADNVGNAEYNRALSLRRANGVVQQLRAGGITEDSITVETKGEDVSNVSRSDRWKSRRVEVALAPLKTESDADTGTEATANP